MSSKYQPELALKEHLLEGHKISQMEAKLLFGVQSPSRALTRIKRDGFLLKKQRVSMAKIVRRLNELASYTPPKNLPLRELSVIEYWVSE